jgi:hypothetical protein
MSPLSLLDLLGYLLLRRLLIGSLLGSWRWRDDDVARSRDSQLLLLHLLWLLLLLLLMSLLRSLLKWLLRSLLRALILTIL